MNRIVYDGGSGNRLRKIEDRRHGMALYDDLDGGGRVVCHTQSVTMYPRPANDFQPIQRVSEAEAGFRAAIKRGRSLDVPGRAGL